MEQLEQLAMDFIDAKKSEEKAREIRVGIENKILELTGCKEDGAETHNIGEYKIVTKGALRYSCNIEDLDNVEIEGSLKPIKTERKFDLKGFKWLKENDTEVYEKIASVVKITKAKPSVTIQKKG